MSGIYLSLCTNFVTEPFWEVLICYGVCIKSAVNLSNVNCLLSCFTQKYLLKEMLKVSVLCSEIKLG